MYTQFIPKNTKKYAEFLYPEEKEKQAQIIKQKIDKLKEKGEISEAIVLYRLIAKEYPDTQIAAGVCFQIAQIIEEEENKQEAVNQTIREYEEVIKKYPKSSYAEEICFPLVKKYPEGIYLEIINEFLKQIEKAL